MEHAFPAWPDTSIFYEVILPRLPSEAINDLHVLIVRHFTDDEKRDQWARVVAPIGSEGVVEKREATGPAPVHSPLTLYASLISPSTTLSHVLSPSNSLPSKAYVHVVQTSGYNPHESNGAQVTLSSPEGNSVTLKEGDGVYITGDAGQTLSVRNSGDRVAEVLLFDVE